MYTLSNDQLVVSILNPVADQSRFGVRYCTGGYIFQVSDARLGELMSGPTSPDSFNWFDGQGIPDAFNQHPLRDPKGNGETALIIGIGLCNLTERTVTEFCAWDVEQGSDAIRMTTTSTGKAMPSNWNAPFRYTSGQSARTPGWSMAARPCLSAGFPIPSTPRRLATNCLRSTFWSQSWRILATSWPPAALSGERAGRAVAD